MRSQRDSVAVQVTDGTRSMKGRELTAVLALSMSVTALGVDIILPAFADIRSEFGLASDSTAVAGLITTYLLGLSASQLIYGLLSDRFGRRPILYAGLVIYIAGAVASALAPSLAVLLAARFVWGAGAASPRILTLSILRDTYSGERMAKAMSFVMALFLLVPVVAPTIGALLTDWISWRGAVSFTVVAALVVALWAIRLPETLKPQHRLNLTVADILRAGKLVITNRVTVGYMLAFTVLFGGFASYLASSELIISDVFGLGDAFPVIFGALAIVMGIAVLVNGNLVERVGLQRVLRLVMVGYVAAAGAMTLLSLLSNGRPSFWLFAPVLAGVLSMHALLIPNMNTAAMIPMASVAGTASAVISTVATALGALIGAAIDQAYDGTVGPFSFSLLILGIFALGLTRWAAGGLRAETDDPVAKPAG